MIYKKKICTVLMPLFNISCLWVVPSLLLYLLGDTVFGGLFASKFFSFILLSFFVFLLSSMMVMFFRYEKEVLIGNNSLRRNLIVLCVVLRLAAFQVEHSGTCIGVFAGIVGTASLIIFSCLLGAYLSTAVNRLTEIIPVCSVAFTVDLYSVLRGPSKEIAVQIGKFYSEGATGSVPLADMILVKIVNPSVEYLIPVFGVSDWIFIVFFSSVMLKFQLADGVVGKSLKDMEGSSGIQFYFPLISLGLLISVLTAYMFNLFIPALPVILVIVLPWLIVQNHTLFRLRASDYILTLVPPVMALLLFLYS